MREILLILECSTPPQLRDNGLAKTNKNCGWGQNIKASDLKTIRRRDIVNLRQNQSHHLDIRPSKNQLIKMVNSLITAFLIG